MCASLVRLNVRRTMEATSMTKRRLIIAIVFVQIVLIIALGVISWAK
jgi:hypothetical protein